METVRSMSIQNVGNDVRNYAESKLKTTPISVLFYIHSFTGVYSPGGTFGLTFRGFLKPFKAER
jgi:hypothetical protein